MPLLDGPETLAKHENFDSGLLTSVANTFATNIEGAEDVQEVAPAVLENGMILMEDLYTDKSILIVPRGYMINAGCRDHLMRFEDGLGSDRIRLRLHADADNSWTGKNRRSSSSLPANRA